MGKYPSGTSPTTSSCSAETDQTGKRCSLDFYSGNFGIEKSRIVEIVNQATEELRKMATVGEPLWIRSFETGREILNYDEYMKDFSVGQSTKGQTKRSSVEASRETGVVFMDLATLVQSFMDVVSLFTHVTFEYYQLTKVKMKFYFWNNESSCN